MGTERAKPEEIDALFDFLVVNGQVTRKEICEELGVRLRRADVIIRALRITFGDTDDINLVCQRTGFGQPHIYFLTGRLDGAKPWTYDRVADVETRLETIESVIQSMVKATDGRTVDGKLARLLARTLSRAREDIGLLRE